MFDNMYFQKRIKVDSGRRIILPAETRVLAGSQIAFADFDSYYGLYLLERISNLVDFLKEQRFMHPDDQRVNTILNDINFIFRSIKDIYTVDTQRRIHVPLEKGSTIVLQGRDDHLFLFPSEEAYQVYDSNIKQSIVLH